MKTPVHLLLSLLACADLFLTAPARAQTFTNSNLDTWAVRNGVDAPANWQTTDDVAAYFIGARFPTNAVVKTTVVHGGTYAAQLQTQLLLGLGQIPGAITLGTSLQGIALPLGSSLPSGIPFTTRPANLQFYYQLSGPQAVADSAAMAVKLMRRVNGVATVVAQARYYVRALASTYTLASVPLQYSSALTPDSVSLVFLSGTARAITVGTVFRVDDVSFTGTATATRDAAQNAALSVAPNPSADGRYLLSSTEPALLAAPLTVLDATGRTVRRELAPAPALSRTLDLNDLPAGLYTLLLTTPNGTVSRRLVR
ncbi:T9SS type A sorting domain-containing protein [Hymenobacter rubidus]|uniref:T9SS type A sorting domain-containing protein n=1 Tax=Hymenobacter rubidus TaxID=1441626 RepID=UPI00191E2FA3|nr:T9SS type A sorting domain-containing protein [Hymenobacter rubidus]